MSYNKNQGGKNMSKLLFMIFGVFFMLLGFIGLILPIVPQVPFLMTGGVLLSMGSEKIKKKIIHSGIYNKYLKEYVSKYKITRRIFGE